MKKILFVCVENSCRSQMAEGFMKFYAKGGIEAFSAGSSPSGKVNENAIKVMAEIGIDISKNTSKGFADLPYKQFDYVVTMGCGDTYPFVPAKEYIEWQVPDPKGKDFDFFRETRNIIENNVIILMVNAGTYD